MSWNFDVTQRNAETRISFFRTKKTVHVQSWFGLTHSVTKELKMILHENDFITKLRQELGNCIIFFEKFYHYFFQIYLNEKKSWIFCMFLSTLWNFNIFFCYVWHWFGNIFNCLLFLFTFKFMLNIFYYNLCSYKQSFFFLIKMLS